MKFRFLRFVLVVITVGLISQKASSINVKGFVFLDKNRNGVKDDQERGIKNVPVSNGDTIVLTNRKGQFQIEIAGGCSLFPILLSNFEMEGKVLNSGFKYFPEVSENAQKYVEFPMIKKAPENSFRIGAIGDVQVDNLQEVHYANKTIMKELAQRNDIDFNVFMGDQVNSGSHLETYIKDMLEVLNSPSWTVFGNHDRIIETQEQDSLFNSNFGASTYAFNYGNVHFIILNNVWSDGRHSYEGRFREKQIRFVKNSLSLIPEDRLVVICQHIPMVYTKNRQSLLSLFGNQRKVLILSGHMHRVSRHVFSDNISELVVGAASGNWWTGERNYQGIPHALMQDGTPRNYFLIDFENNDYRLTFKGVGKDENHQMEIWVSHQDSIDDFLEVGDREVFVNIFAGSENTKVFMQINTSEWIEMKKQELVAPLVNRLYFLNRKKVYPTEFSRKSALRKSTSSHIWTGTIPGKFSNKIYRINVKAYDGFGFKVTGSTLFML